METIKLIRAAATPRRPAVAVRCVRHEITAELKLSKNPDCPVCGKRIRRLRIDRLYELRLFDGEGSPRQTLQVPEIAPRELKCVSIRGRRPFILDVREPARISNLQSLNGHLISRLRDSAAARVPTNSIHRRKSLRTASGNKAFADAVWELFRKSGFSAKS